MNITNILPSYAAEDIFGMTAKEIAELEALLTAGITSN